MDSAFRVSNTGLIDLSLQPGLERQQIERSEEYRRQISHRVEPLIRLAQDSDKSSIELGQAIVKTGTLLNGGALVAIPAVISLFGIDAKSIMQDLFVAGGLFVLGLLCSWLSAICGFFTLRVRSERYQTQVNVTRAYISRDLAEDPETETFAEGNINRLQKNGKRQYKNLVVMTAVAISVCFLSLASFVIGSGVTTWTVLHAP